MRNEKERESTTATVYEKYMKLIPCILLFSSYWDVRLRFLTGLPLQHISFNSMPLLWLYFN